ncbi:hypothetical protein B7494_g5183 [Chlorociboria aeruginascens]|nr:hypothetical protein B7494_g5183 [Chlorociboria aeruginascens]
MPWGIKHSNRSKSALNSQGHPEGEHYEDAEANQYHPHQPRLQSQPYVDAPRSPGLDVDHRLYQTPNTGEIPSRSQTIRYSNPYPQPIAIPYSAGSGSSADDLAIDTRRLQQQQQQQQQQGRRPSAPAQSPAVETKKSKSLFDRMRSGRTSEKQGPGAYSASAGVGRRLSKRQESPPALRTPYPQVQQRPSLDQQRADWQGTPSSRSDLPSPQEGAEDDNGLDPFLITIPNPEQPRNLAQEQSQQFQQPTIRTVEDASEPPTSSAIEEANQQLLHQQQQQQQQQPQQPQQQSPHHTSPDSVHSNHYQLSSHSQSVNTSNLSINDSLRPQNSETASQLSHESPIDQREERPSSKQSNGPSPTSGNSLRQEYPNRTSSIQGPRPLSQHIAMGPPAGGTQQNRRSAADPKLQLQPDSRDQNYNRQSYPNNQQPPTPGISPVPPPTGSAQGPNYRGGPPQRDQYGAPSGGEQGRSTPPPAPAERDVNDAYKELLKGLYFDKTSQVEQLQNTLANQRLSQSRTSLDDSEYMTRFQRLDGATTNLAFNIRKEWRSIPNWLAPYVNQDALKIGKQEMTGVGRACITRFLVEEIFSRTFHPGLEPELSVSLKIIEQNIRRFSPVLNNQEESDALTAKVVHWRLATLDGLQDILHSSDSDAYRAQFTRMATTNLTASLINFLQEPMPAGIEDSAHMIVELAVSIASNLPLESRDISIVYPMPGDLLQPFIMKVETGIPALDNPVADASSEIDASSTGSGDKDESSKDPDKGDGKSRKEKGKNTGMLQAMMGGGPPIKKVNSQGSAENVGEPKGKVSSEDAAQKIRFAGFVGVEVRGRQILGKAPVWTVG